ncbi:MAG: class I SAM-dependent methyltransferase [Candidatus Magasanikbacteria bacterium]|nr:class I SAM-dependent methyltransferase [Candidatus Magasanikbacteria bacterium]
MTFDRNLKNTFDNLSKLYDEVRPTYPPELINDIVAYAHLKPDAQILDIGCGSGQATIPFAERGYSIVGIDISENLLEIAQEKTVAMNTVSYLKDSFENAEFEPESFDLLIAAQAFHWIDPDIGYPKSREILKSGGTFALFWNEPKYHEHWLAEVEKLFFKLCPKYKYTNPSAIVEQQTITLHELGQYNTIENRHYSRILQYSKEKFKLLLTTFSWVSSLPPEAKETFMREIDLLIAEQGETLEVPYQTYLFLAKK